MLLLSPPNPAETLAELVERLGDVPLWRIRLHPAPGAAVEADVLWAGEHDHRLCELVDGVLVEKGMGFREAILAGVLVEMLRQFVVPRNLGHVTGADGMVRLSPGLVRIPDAAFISWKSFPGGELPTDPIPTLAPDLAIEVASRSNTAREIDRKVAEYSQAGSRLVWIVFPETRSITAYRSPADFSTLGESETLTADDILPGFRLSLTELFAELDRTPGVSGVG